MYHRRGGDGAGGLPVAPAVSGGTDAAYRRLYAISYGCQVGFARGTTPRARPRGRLLPREEGGAQSVEPRVRADPRCAHGDGARTLRSQRYTRRGAYPNSAAPYYPYHTPAHPDGDRGGPGCGRLGGATPDRPAPTFPNRPQSRSYPTEHNSESSDGEGG